MKVVKGTEEELNNLAGVFASIGRSILEPTRSFDENGNLRNLRNGETHSSVTNLKEPVRQDSIQGFYLPHPEIKLGDWGEEAIGHFIKAIPEHLEIIDNFQPTPEDELN